MSYKVYFYITFALVVLAALIGILTFFECVSLFLLLRISDELQNLVAYKKKEDAILERLVRK